MPTNCWQSKSYRILFLNKPPPKAVQIHIACSRSAECLCANETRRAKFRKARFKYRPLVPLRQPVAVSKELTSNARPCRMTFPAAGFVQRPAVSAFVGCHPLHPMHNVGNHQIRIFRSCVLQDCLPLTPTRHRLRRPLLPAIRWPSPLRALQWRCGQTSCPFLPRASA